MSDRLQDCPSVEKLAEFNHGRLAETDIDAIADHLAHCETCRIALDSLTGGDPLLHGLQSAPPVDEFGQETVRQGTLLEPPADKSVEPIPRILGYYRLIDELGAGGMGVVYSAEHIRLQRTVALKVVSRRLANSQAIARFEREMVTLGKLDHPNLTRATDAGESQGVHYLVMDLIDGVDAGTAGRAMGQLRVADACEIVRQAALGLQYAHDTSLIHRDVKPSNIMIDQSGQVRVLDLGLAALREPTDEEDELTSSGQVMGTLEYMAPEQLDDSRGVDERADVYGLGATLYRLLTGSAPIPLHHHKTWIARIAAISTAIPADARKLNPKVSADLSALLTRMLAKTPQDRVATAGEVAKLMESFSHGHRLGELVNSTRSGKVVDASETGTDDAVASRTVVERARRRSHLPFITAAFACLIIVCLAILLVVAPWNRPNPPPASTDPADVQRRVAIRILEAGGTLEFITDSNDDRIESIDELPEGPFEIDVIELHKREHIDDEWINRHLQPLDSVYLITLNSTGITDEALGRVGQFRSLAMLNLADTVVGDEGMSHLNNHQFATLNLHGTRVSSETVRGLGLQREIELITISMTRFDNSGVELISQWTSLTDINIGGNPIDDEGVKSLSRLKNLSILSVNDTLVSDASIGVLSSLSELRFLDIRETRISPEGHAQLVANLPDCTIVYDGKPRE